MGPATVAGPWDPPPSGLTAVRSLPSGQHRRRQAPLGAGGIRIKGRVAAFGGGSGGAQTPGRGLFPVSGAGRTGRRAAGDRPPPAAGGAAAGTGGAVRWRAAPRCLRRGPGRGLGPRDRVRMPADRESALPRAAGPGMCPSRAALRDTAPRHATHRPVDVGQGPMRALPPPPPRERATHPDRLQSNGCARCRTPSPPIPCSTRWPAAGGSGRAVRATQPACQPRPRNGSIPGPGTRPTAGGSIGGGLQCLFFFLTSEPVLSSREALGLAARSQHQCCRAQCSHAGSCVPRRENMDLCLRVSLVRGSAAGAAARKQPGINLLHI